MPRSFSIFFVVFLAAASLLGACSEKGELKVSKISPSRGPYIGGDPVTIAGSGFTASQIDAIYFGKSPAKRPIVKESGEIVVDPPAGQIGQTVDVIIILADSRTIKIPNAYTYIDPTAGTPK